MVKGVKSRVRVRFLTGMTIAERNGTLDGEKDGLKGMKGFGSDAAVAHLRAEVDRYAALRSRPG